MLEDLFANPAPRKGRGANYLFPAFWTRPNGGVGLDETLQVRLLLVQFQPAAPAGDLVEAQLAGIMGSVLLIIFQSLANSKRNARQPEQLPYSSPKREGVS